MSLFLAFGMPAAPEWIFISILALVLFGPKKLPELARGLGKALGELQKAKEDFHREITGVPPLPKIQPPEGLQQVVYSPPPSLPESTPVTPILEASSPTPTITQEEKKVASGDAPA